MRLMPSDPDISSIVTRIQRGDINLQPEFQRGEVWSVAKKQKLIDSILRQWHIPPIHVIEIKDTMDVEVLDGQQRLASIRDFVNNKFRIDGYNEPINDEIVELDGLSYSQLPTEWRRKFEQFPIRIFTIIDYEPQEPGELFYRLNQPVVLTAAEQRNAFFSEPRRQVKELVEILESTGVNKGFIGFSNARMAYDDVIARFCYYLESGNLLRRLNSIDLTNRYRFNKPFEVKTIELAKSSIQYISEIKRYNDFNIKFNKASLFSWLWFISANITDGFMNIDYSTIANFISYFEDTRAKLRSSNFVNDKQVSLFEDRMNPILVEELISIYNDRSSSRVSDVSSILSRDIIIWVLFLEQYKPSSFADVNNSRKYKMIKSLLSSEDHWHRIKAETLIYRLIEMGWDGRVKKMI